MATKVNQNKTVSTNKSFRDNSAHTPIFKKAVPMPPIKPAPTTPTSKPPKK